MPKNVKSWGFSYSLDEKGALRVYTPGSMLINEIPDCGNLDKDCLDRLISGVIAGYIDGRKVN